MEIKLVMQGKDTEEEEEKEEGEEEEEEEKTPGLPFCSALPPTATHDIPSFSHSVWG